MVRYFGSPVNSYSRVDADDFGNLRVRVDAVQPVLAARQRIENLRMVECGGQRQVIGVAGDGIQICQRLGHAALLVFERPLHLVVRNAVHAEFHPVGHFFGDGQRLFVATQAICIEKSGENFVQGIPRRPDRFALLDAVNERFGKRR